MEGTNSVDNSRLKTRVAMDTASLFKFAALFRILSVSSIYLEALFKSIRS